MALQTFARLSGPRTRRLNTNGSAVVPPPPFLVEGVRHSKESLDDEDLDEDPSALKQSERFPSVSTVAATDISLETHPSASTLAGTVDLDSENSPTRPPPPQIVVEQGISVPNNASTKTDDDAENRPLLYARLIYPGLLGLTEANGSLILKSINSLATTTLDEDADKGSQSTATILWFALFIIGLFLFLVIVLELRLTYRRFEIPTAFPVEFGMITFVSVVGGFAVFEDWQYVSEAGTWVAVILAGAAIMLGIFIVGYAGWRAAVAGAEEKRVTSEGAGRTEI